MKYVRERGSNRDVANPLISRLRLIATVVPGVLLAALPYRVAAKPR